MSIPFDRFVDIISGVGGGAGVRTRDLIGRFFTSSPFVSPDTVLEFTNAADVATYFGSTSEEARRAVAYFAYVSPAVSKPQRISFAAYDSGGNNAEIIGNNDFKSVGNFKLVTAGQFSITLGAVVIPITGLDLTAVTSLADVATEIQIKVRAANVALATATVTYGTYNPQRFVISVPGAFATISAQSTAGGSLNDLGLLMGITKATNAINITGSDATTPLGAFIRAEGITNNFGSFTFIPLLPLVDATDVAAYNDSQNVKYQYHARVTALVAQDWYDALNGYSGVGLTLAPIDTEYPEILPMSILASTRYDTRNATQNYMYKQIGGLTSSVSTGPDADKYDAIRVNYYGDTSSAGQKIPFYMRGTLMGGATAPVDMGVYANEQWLKDTAGARIMQLQLSVGRIPANAEGAGSIGNVIQGVIDRALFNGTISTGKKLTDAQKVYITQQTGDNLSWQTVQSAGYVLDVTIEPYTTVSGAVEYKALYQLIYSKDDAVRKVEGRHQLI